MTLPESDSLQTETTLVSENSFLSSTFVTKLHVPDATQTPILPVLNVPKLQSEPFKLDIQTYACAIQQTDTSSTQIGTFVSVPAPTESKVSITEIMTPKTASYLAQIRAT
jgi:hypothetical protein